MRLVIVGLNFAPELTGIGKYTGEMAAWFAARGHDVSVITTRPYYPEWRRTPGLAAWTWRSEVWQGCRVTRCPLYVPSRPTGLKRVLHLASFGLSSAPVAALEIQRGKADVVAVMAPTLFSVPAALAAAWMLSAKAWLHVLDLEVDAAFELGFIRSRGLIGAARRMERLLMRRFDLVSTISSRMSEAIAGKGVANDRLILFPNWVDTDRFRPLDHPSPLRRELGIPDGRCVALYSGSMGKKQGLEHVIAAARQAASDRDSPLFLLAGGGPLRAELERSASGLGNVRFLPLQPAERFNDFLNVADIHLLPQRRDASDLVMPSKLLAMLATGRPVVATAPPGSEIALTLVDAGVITPPEEPASLAAAILRLAADPGARQRMGSAGALLARSSMHTETIMRRIEAQLTALVGQRGATRLGTTRGAG
ncbi:MAG TPA: WcaI family glycosyltransferase [Stellaceae bacterium]|nr:WcaI family glycosyltransferase [Stellaceae bacterium]